MKQIFSKQIKKNLSTEHLDIYLIAVANFFLMIGMVIGRNSFIHGFTMPLIIIGSLSLLLTKALLKINTTSFKVFMSKIDKTVLNVIMIELVLLFGLPQVFPRLYLQMQVVVAFAVQSAAMVFFYRAYKPELQKFFSFGTNVKKDLQKELPELVSGYTGTLIQASRIFLSKPKKLSD